MNPVLPEIPILPLPQPQVCKMQHPPLCTWHFSRLDPTMTSGPMMATVVDTSGLYIYLQIARHFIKDINIDQGLSDASSEQAQVRVLIPVD